MLEQVKRVDFGSEVGENQALQNLPKVMRILLSQHINKKQISTPLKPISGLSLEHNSKVVQFPIRYRNRLRLFSESDFTDFTTWLLETFYPKSCPKCGSSSHYLVKSREHKQRCSVCHTDYSRLSYTPLHGFRLPLWNFGYILYESFLRYPQVVNSREIRQRLGISNNGAYMLKRRLQLFASDQLEWINKLITKELQTYFPTNDSKNIEQIHSLQEKIPSTDTVALFSASQRSNNSRARYKHAGQTSSIYLSPEVANERGKYQIGTLVNHIGIKKRGVILSSIPDQKQSTLQPILDTYIPRTSLVFSDQGISWYSYFNSNHRMINHSARSKDKRYRYAKNRWCKDGVHSQVSEGYFRILKHSFISGYGYVSPKYSQLYLNEFSFLKNFLIYFPCRGSSEWVEGIEKSTSTKVLEENVLQRETRCSPGRTRTCDQLINSQLLYRLSYRGLS